MSIASSTTSASKDYTHRTANLRLAMLGHAPDAAALGRAVHVIRAERRISQVQLASATGFRQSWVSNVEHGRRNPSWSNVVRLAEGLGVRTSALVKRAEALAGEPR
jgi:DNA-binding XRE family transcriptional regulator